MKIKRFRIERFRSIKNTEWLPFSEDGITALVGQNESGKSSILDALHLGFSLKPSLVDDDFRMGEVPPQVTIEFFLEDNDIEEVLEKYPDSLQKSLAAILKEQRVGQLNAKIVKNGKYFRSHYLSEDFLVPFTSLFSSEEALEFNDASQGGVSLQQLPPKISPDLLATSIWEVVPDFILFKDDSSQLPNKIDIEDGKLSAGSGLVGANNYLKAAKLNVAELLSSNDRAAATLLAKANERVTVELQRFWSQILGETRRIRIDCELKNRAQSDSDKAGEPYLVFWISESGEKLYPSQRSKGTRWFISFFLQLLARQSSENHSVILLDEPGAFLHATAQADVVRLIEHLAKAMPVVYSTHSPYLLDQRKLHRILAVERIDEEDESPTYVRRGLEIATASPLTLAPILTLIGVDLGHQQIIRKDGNLLLEEVSAYYYMMAFHKILEIPEDISFVAAGGVDNVRLMVDLFVAWRLGFSILVDDDQHGKRVCREIKSKYHLSDDFASKRLMRFGECDGVEDMFGFDDFSKFVCEIDRQGDEKVSQSVKRLKISKPLVAVGFYNRAMSGEIKSADLPEDLILRFKGVFDQIKASFSN